MRPEEAAEHVALIREVVARSRAERAQAGDIYLVWGVVVVAADLITLGLGSAGFADPWLAWPLLMPVGVAYAAWSDARRGASVRTFGARVEGRLWMASGMVWTAILLAAAAAGWLALELLVPLISGAIAVAMFTSGALFDSRQLTASGALFGVVGVLGTALPLVPQHLVFDAVVLLTYVAPPAVGWLRGDA